MLVACVRIEHAVTAREHRAGRLQAAAAVMQHRRALADAEQVGDGARRVLVVAAQKFQPLARQRVAARIARPHRFGRDEAFPSFPQKHGGEGGRQQELAAELALFQAEAVRDGAQAVLHERGQEAPRLRVGRIGGRARAAVDGAHEARHHDARSPKRRGIGAGVGHRGEQLAEIVVQPRVVPAKARGDDGVVQDAAQRFVLAGAQHVHRRARAAQPVGHGDDAAADVRVCVLVFQRGIKAEIQRVHSLINPISFMFLPGTPSTVLSPPRSANTIL